MMINSKMLKKYLIYFYYYFSLCLITHWKIKIEDIKSVHMLLLEISIIYEEYLYFQSTFTYIILFYSQNNQKGMNMSIS